MDRITSNQVSGLMEAYASVYSPRNSDKQIWEEAGYLTEEFVLESYQVVADYLVNYGVVPGYETAELFMSEMALEDIDNILFETGVLDEEYLTEAGFFQGLGARADRAVSGAVNRARQVGQTVSGAAQRAGSAVAGAGRAVASSAQRAGQTVAGAAQRAGQTVSGAAQRAGSAAVRAATPVAQAVRGTAQRAVSAGQSALGGAVRAGQAVSGAAQRAGSAVAGAAQGAARRVGQEIEISRRVGAGLPPTASSTTAKASPAPAARPAAAAPAAARPAAARPAAAAPAAARPAAAAPAAARPAAAAPAAARPAAAAPTATTTTATPAPAKKPSLASQAAELRAMRAASQKRQGLTQSFDVFDVIKGHLLDEGYADTEEAALAIMANMSEEWRQSIVEADSVEAMRARAAKRREQRYGKQGGGGRDDYKPYTEDDYKKSSGAASQVKDA